MKKVVALLLAFCIVLVMFAGCTSQETPSADPATPASDAAQTPESSGPEETEPPVTEIAWPEKPITILASGAAGGGIDLQARVYAAFLEKELGVSVVVQNAGNTATYQAFKQSANDGYTLMFTSAAFLVQEGLGSLGFSFDDSCVPVTMFSTSGTNGLYVRSDSKYQTIQDLIEDIQAHPGEIQIGIASATYFHTFPAALENALGIDYDMVDCGTDNERTLALVGGHIDVIVSQYNNAVRPYIDSGEVRALAVAQDERHPLMPDSPTLKESGYDFSYPGQVMMVVAPYGTDSAIIGKINSAVNNFLDDEDFKENMATLGVDPYPAMTMDETTALMLEVRETVIKSCDLIM